MHLTHAHGYTLNGASVSGPVNMLPTHPSGVSSSASGQSFSHVLASAQAHSGTLGSREGKASVPTDGGHVSAQYSMADVIARIRSTHEKGTDSDFLGAARIARWIADTGATTSGHIQEQGRAEISAFRANEYVNRANKPAHDGVLGASGVI